MTLKNLTEIEIKYDLTEAAYYLDKCLEQSKLLNDKLGYVSNIRYTQFISIQVSRSNSSKKSTIIFVDMPDCEKLQTNLIDYQKIYEMILLNNSYTALGDLLCGFQRGTYTL